MFCLTVFAPVLGIFERNDPNGVTRKECPVCDGKCFIKEE